MLDLGAAKVFTADDFARRARDRALPLDLGDLPLSGLSRMHLGMTEVDVPDETLCGVLVPVIERPDGATVLLTRRAAHLKSHAGQIALPGGKAESADRSLADTALREAWEETGLPPSHVTTLSLMPGHRTGTGFRIVAVLGIVRPGFALRLETAEVDDVFEAPLSHLMTAANHQSHTALWQGAERQYYAIPYGERFIWGATAAILKSIHDRLYL